MIYKDLPKDEAHGWKFIAIGPDNKLYIPVGQPGNNVLHDKDHGQIRRINLDGTGREDVALGVRNSVGFDWNPVNKQLYFSDNGRDWMSEDVPQDELNRVTKVGQDFGAPYCYQGNLAGSGIRLGPQVQRLRSAGRLDRPALGRRWACASTPATCSRRSTRTPIFLARHGSWNRTNKFGGDVVAIFLNKDGTVKSMEPFITGFLVDNKIYRPSGGRGDHERRIDAAVRRLERRDLSHQLRQGAHGQPLTEDAGNATAFPAFFSDAVSSHAYIRVAACRRRGVALRRQHVRSPPKHCRNARRRAWPATARTASRKIRKFPRSADRPRPTR